MEVHAKVRVGIMACILQVVKLPDTNVSDFTRHNKKAFTTGFIVNLGALFWLLEISQIFIIYRT